MHFVFVVFVSEFIYPYQSARFQFICSVKLNNQEELTSEKNKQIEYTLL